MPPPQLRLAWQSVGQKDVDGSQSAWLGTTFTTTDTLGCAFDVDNKSITFYKNGTLVGTFSFTTVAGWYPTVSARGTTTMNGWVNFGQRPFDYTPPAGYLAICTNNLQQITR